LEYRQSAGELTAGGELRTGKLEDRRSAAELTAGGELQGGVGLKNSATRKKVELQVSPRYHLPRQ
jgi:hypothetical protein